jgi:D-proline reductase (dithiol) PrdB
MSNPNPAVVPEDVSLGFSDEIDVPTRYMQRTRDYYLTLGYGNPYRWASFNEVPFTPLSKPLSESRVALVTTAARFDPALGDQGPDAPYNAGAKFYTPYTGSTDETPDLRISHIGYDRKNTRPDDQESYFPLARLKEAQANGRFGSLSSRFYAAPTNRSQRVTIETDAPQILASMREDGVDVALIVAT